MRTLLLIIVLLGLGCATPMKYTNSTFTTYDKNTEYAIDPMDDGFSITVYYSRYQFFPESDAVAVACKSALTALAYDYADKNNKKIQTINEQRIKISMGRNDFSGITSCSANALAQWQK
ncbi:MAG: hypothetical protein M0R70_13345 [Nitrospirae bacterium]|nr:hypothetical protein [Nitrospirota bacterium]